jgi:predicted kinase
MVYRALVRAKVAAIRARQPATHARGITSPREECLAYLRLACRLAHRSPPLLVLMHGLSCSGKTTVSQRLLEALGAVRIRTDVERKRLRGVDAGESLAAAPGEGAYAPDESARVYAHAARLAAACLDAGHAVIVDATFLEQERRAEFAALARSLGAAIEIVECRCPEDILRARALRRAAEGRDASDADARVLEWQLAHVEPLATHERLHAVAVDTSHPGEWQAAVESLARRFRVSVP